MSISISIPESDTWLVDALKTIASRKDDPSVSVSSICRNVLKSALIAHKPPSLAEIRREALLDNGWDGPNDPF